MGNGCFYSILSLKPLPFLPNFTILPFIFFFYRTFPIPFIGKGKEIPDRQ